MQKRYFKPSLTCLKNTIAEQILMEPFPRKRKNWETVLNFFGMQFSIVVSVVYHTMQVGFAGRFSRGFAEISSRACQRV